MAAGAWPTERRDANGGAPLIRVLGLVASAVLAYTGYRLTFTSGCETAGCAPEVIGIPLLIVAAILLALLLGLRR